MIINLISSHILVIAYSSLLTVCLLTSYSQIAIYFFLRPSYFIPFHSCIEITLAEVNYILYYCNLWLMSCVFSLQNQPDINQSKARSCCKHLIFFLYANRSTVNMLSIVFLKYYVANDLANTLVT